MNYNKFLIRLSFLILVAILLVVGCEKKEIDKTEIPMVKTELVSEITVNTAVSGGKIISDGGAEITSKGILWSEDIEPTIEQNIGITDAGSGPEDFKGNMSNLKSKTVYFVRAYAKNAAGVGYGDQFNFLTLEKKPPIAAFKSDLITGDVPLLVQFTDLSTEDPNQWLWEFGNGTTSNNQNPSHIYQSAGTFNVKLTATNPIGSNQTTEDYFIIVKPVGIAPVAEFTALPRQGAAPLTVDFIDQTSNNPTIWKWSFGDGTSNTERNPSYTYQNPGTYTVKLEVKNDFGEDVIVKSDLIAVSPGGTAPVADFSGTPTSGKSPLVVSFTDLSTNTPTTWLWNFGDGSSSTEKNPSYTYQNPGSYTVKLEAKNDFGEDAAVKNNYITVSPAGVAPVANFSGTPLSGNSPLTVSFTDLSTNSPTNWLWTFGDGTHSQQKNPSHTYQQAGTYNVSLTVGNSFGNDVLIKQNYIVVNQIQYKWLSYDNGTNYTGVGLIDGGEWDVAIRFASSQLQQYNGWKILSVRFFPKEYNVGYAIEGFIGSNPSPGSPVFYKAVNNPSINSWNEVSLNQPYTINANTDLWVGYFIYNQPAGTWPAGADSGPAVVGYGDMVNNGDGWVSLSASDLDYNWNIQVRISNAKGESRLISIDKDKKPPINKNQSKGLSSKK